ncbi:MAG: CapA family protein [Polyangiaceae bacterium]
MRGGWVTTVIGLMGLLGCDPERAPAPPVETADATASASVAAGASASVRDPAPAGPTPRSTIAFVGDLNLSLHVGINLAKLAEGASVPEGIAAGYPFLQVRDRLRAADFTVGNLECVVSVKGEVDTWHNPFRCPAAPAVLVDAGFDLVSLANNHALDYGRVGLEDMVKNLDAAELPHFGRENLVNLPQPVSVHVVGGVKVGLLAYYVLPKPPFEEVVAARKKVDRLITFMHWGAEGQTEPLLLQRRLAKELLTAGVDAVVGTHAHVPQPVEWYDGKLIAHGLGNFVFSGMTHTENHRTGDILELDIDATGIVAQRLVRIRLGEDGAPRLVDGGIRDLTPPSGGTSPSMASLPGEAVAEGAPEPARR